MSIKLRELIRAVRACKTAAEERGVIAKECALCRTAFKSRDNKFRHRNVAKLMYIHMLGYPTHFGQMESLKLVASNDFADKRIGYLGLMILLDEKQSVLMLVTNSLKMDFESKNAYVVGLALTALGNISSADIARDLSNEVEKFFHSSNVYLRKKAALCAIRIIRKVPDLIEDFVPAVTSLLQDKNHAVLFTGVSLIIEMIKIDPSVTDNFRKMVPTIVRLLKSLVLAGYVSDYDVVGITDPFLQVKILQLLRLLGQGDSEASDFMNDILAQVAINTEPSKNPGNAILYECVNTIMSIEAEGGLRVLAINILGRFLLNRDNNIRYVALNTLCRVINRDTAAIQRQRNTVVVCLKDADISIRRRALDLIYALVTKNNVKALVKELLNYLALTSGDLDFKADMADKICIVVQKHAPSRKWHIDTLLQVLASAGDVSRDYVPSDLIQLIGRSVELQPYCVHKIFSLLKGKKKVDQLPLLHVGAWCIGEFGDHLVSSDGAEQANAQIEGKSPYEEVSEHSAIVVLNKILDHPLATTVTKQYVLTATVKLAARFTEERALSNLQLILKKYDTSICLELQSRSAEFSYLISPQLAGVRAGVLGRMPVPPEKKSRQEDDDDSSSEDDEDDEEDEEEEEEDTPASSQTPAPASTPGVMDLGIFDINPDAVQETQAAPTPAPVAATGSLDILSGLFDALPAEPQQQQQQQPQNDGLADFLDFDTPAPQPTGIPPVTVFQKNGLSIVFNYEKVDNPAVINVMAQFQNGTGGNISNLDFQVAVPKYLKLNMQSPSSQVLQPGGQATQNLSIANSLHGQKRVVIRVRITYHLNGQPVVEQAQIDQFPN